MSSSRSLKNFFRSSSSVTLFISFSFSLNLQSLRQLSRRLPPTLNPWLPAPFPVMPFPLAVGIGPVGRWRIWWIFVERRMVVKLSAQRARLPGNEVMIIGSAFLPAYLPTAGRQGGVSSRLAREARKPRKQHSQAPANRRKGTRSNQTKPSPSTNQTSAFSFRSALSFHRRDAPACRQAGRARRGKFLFGGKMPPNGNKKNLPLRSLRLRGEFA